MFTYLPSDDEIKEAIQIGYDEAIALANYIEINNCTSQKQISYNETSSDNNTNASEIIDNEDDQDQNPVEIQINSENIGTAAFQFDPFFIPEFLCSEILISIRKNHDALSRHSKRISNNQISTTSSLNLNSANRLITEFTNNSIQENHVNKRKDGWEGRKRLGTIPITDGINGIFNSIMQMYISNVHLLIPNGYLIIYSDKKLCIAQIILMYEKRGERHAWVNKDSNS
ncbi:unnamed protein product [Rhizophagus irregularis]|uniref:Uncharacterized protein n=1 Tax=Rhizophagus irregularis TaxID=588596 RepID=A0A2N1MVH4_9GLOM|nr:hypothetical protein RhiirC2_785799 [Rhizophagus irregularis]CAB5378329.1 unnamed protein product [Rhizophagus irregularis]